MAENRTPLGDDVVHVGGPEFVANAGRVERGGPAQGGLGELSRGAGSWGSTGSLGQPYTAAGEQFPTSPSVESLQVNPKRYPVNYEAGFPANGGEEAWKGERPDVPNTVTGFPAE